MLYSFSSTLAGPPDLPSASRCFRPGLSTDPCCFCNRVSSNSRLGSAEIPQPSVDINKHGYICVMMQNTQIGRPASVEQRTQGVLPS